MNSETQRGSDSENFGTRITRFGIVVEKIWSFEFAKTMDCGSISKKPSGLFAKFLK
jgi:hypothetical protein